MDKKKALKIVAASTVAASAFVSAAPASQAAAVTTTSASKAVKVAEGEAIKLQNLYNAKKLTTKKISVKAATAAADKAMKEVKKLAKGKVKTGLETRLKSVASMIGYAERFNMALDHAATLSTATKKAQDDMKKFDLVTAKKDAAALATSLKAFEKFVVKGSIYGEGTRAQMTAMFATPAKKAAKDLADMIKKEEDKAEASDVQKATTAVEALEKAVKELKDDASVATAEKLATDAKEALKAVDTKKAKEELTTRIATAEKAVADFKKASEEVMKLEKAVKELKDEATVKAAEELVVAVKKVVEAVKSEDAKKVLMERVAKAEKMIADKKEELSAPKVEKVSAVNGKTITVTFSKALDAKTLKNETGDVITLVPNSDAASPGTVSQELSADGKTLTFKAKNHFKGDYTVKVPFEMVKAMSGQYVNPVNQKVSVNDTAAPELKSVKATVKSVSDKVKTITLTFDEDVKSIDTVKIGNDNYSPSIDGNTATITVGDLDASKKYDVTVVNAADETGNMKDIQTASLMIAVDNVAPSITNVEPVGENKFKVTVDKALKTPLTLSAKVGTFTANIVSDVTNTENPKEYIVTLNSSYLYKNGNTETVNLTVAKDALEDAIGNKNATDITKTVTLNKDVTAPTVNKVETVARDGEVKSFVVTFNEEVTTVTTDKVYVVDSKGEILSLSKVASNVELNSTDKKKVVFTLASGLASDKYSFDLAEGFVTDTSLSKNKSAKYSFMVDVTKPGKPVDTTFTIKDAKATNNVITVDFDAKVKATGTGSALNPASYLVNGVALPSDSEIKFVKNEGVTDQKKVEIHLPKGFVKNSDAKAVFRVTGVQTLDNKVSNPFTSLVDIIDNTAPEAKSFVATDLTELTITYSEAIKLKEKAEGKGNGIEDELQLFDSKGAKVDFVNPKVEGNKLILKVSDASMVAKLKTTTPTVSDILDVAGNDQAVGIVLSK
ncbi:surface layer (S-layer) glycoprotein [Fictibacillus macauensis ZFHKF-1]|uniref:Surface layer (S-layer) glycoprotein n=1 Tax=Fictibacillus macauensis ZFHKF-1 TaxID=1196324 RepID=I8UH75_9BACL|nr:Ig-like domain-containing protein [Fictibacillus macauensis]EIT86255.1 surface layer (S-layer) glycoprotein [Fictibacillus macauensis ZFHKF-1]